MQQIKETLYGSPKGGKIKQWSVYVEGDTVIVEWGRVGGKLQTKDTVCKPKNVGRSNETTAEEQAILEANAKWVKQYDNQLYRYTPEEAQKVGELLPMLAIDGSKKPEKIEYPCDKQPKLDGVRCMVYSEDGEIKAISRKGKFYKLHPELYKELEKMLKDHELNKLDGELYIHGQKLQNIVSAVRNEDSELHDSVKFYLFDIPLTGIPWKDRKKLLDKIPQGFHVNVVRSAQVNNFTEAERSVGEFMQVGFEGTILRNLDGMYEFNHRSNDLIKLKTMYDSECYVVDCTEDKNGEGVLHCTWGKDGIDFKMKMKGSHDQRLYENQKQFIGSWITFKYQAKTEAGRPQFPVGLQVRECDEEGNPLY